MNRSAILFLAFGLLYYSQVGESLLAQSTASGGAKDGGSNSPAPPPVGGQQAAKDSVRDDLLGLTDRVLKLEIDAARRSVKL